MAEPLDGIELDKETVAAHEIAVVLERATYDQVAAELKLAIKDETAIEIQSRLDASAIRERAASDIRIGWLHRRYAELDGRIDGDGQIIPATTKPAETDP